MNLVSKTLLVLVLAFVATGGALYFFGDPPDPALPAAAEHAPASASPRARDAPPPRHDAAASAERKATSSSTDPFEFIRDLAKSAFEGDERAQYLVGRELDRCEMTLSLIRKMEGDPEAIIWGMPESWPQALKERSIAEYRRCNRLLKEDPFAGLPPRQGGYPTKYWMQRSAEAGYPLAVAEKSLIGLLQPPADAADARKARVESVHALTQAAMAGDPDVALTIGLRQSWSEDPVRTTTASAWMLASCRLGADCSANSKVYPFFMCYDPNYPNCDKDGSVEQSVSLGLGPEKYADAYAQSQAIEEVLRSRDSAAIQALLEQLIR